MFSESVTIAIMTSSITGAGLVIAFYALIARMSDRIFANRIEQLDNRRYLIKEITSKHDSFNEENLEKTTKRLDDLRKEINSIKTFPKYLGIGVFFNFLVFIITAILSFSWIFNVQNRNAINEVSLAFSFVLSLLIFLAVGSYGIKDVLDILSTNFKGLKEKKDEVKEEIKQAPQEAKIVEQVQNFLNKIGISFEKEVMIKTNGDRVFADFLLHSKNNKDYVIEVLTRPTSQNVYETSRKYEKYSLQTSTKTILISDFSDLEHIPRTAKQFWDFVVDIKTLDEIKKIIK